MIGAERPRLVPTQWFRPGSPRLVLVTRQSVSHEQPLRYPMGNGYLWVADSRGRFDAGPPLGLATPTIDLCDLCICDPLPSGHRHAVRGAWDTLGFICET